jgi:hypothetical protein
MNTTSIKVTRPTDHQPAKKVKSLISKAIRTATLQARSKALTALRASTQRDQTINTHITMKALTRSKLTKEARMTARRSPPLAILKRGIM